MGIRVGRYLTQNAQKRFDEWSPEVRDWSTFKRNFTDPFPSCRNLGRLLSGVANFNSNQCNTYNVYVHKKSSLLKTCDSRGKHKT